jgi:tetratricopeptide (TPR) repeat protein
MEEFARQEQREAERQKEYRRQLTALLEGAIRFDALALNEPNIITKIRQIAGLQSSGGPEVLGNWLFEKAQEYYETGTRKGSNPDLFIAIATSRAALQEHAREIKPLEWAAIQNELGKAQWTLGERESGTARLEEAVSAFRAALQERTRERVPLDWAATQNGLGNALRALGARERGTARLEESVTAFRAALQERTPERTPHEWAVTQNNLGTALWTIGERESSVARLEEATVAYGH